MTVSKSTREQRAHHTDMIQTSKVVNRLNKQALDSEEMSSKAITAAQILLRKTLPDLKVAEIEVDGHLAINVVNYGHGSDSE